MVSVTTMLPPPNRFLRGSKIPACAGTRDRLGLDSIPTVPRSDKTHLIHGCLPQRSRNSKEIDDCIFARKNRIPELRLEWAGDCVRCVK